MPAVCRPSRQRLIAISAAANNSDQCCSQQSVLQQVPVTVAKAVIHSRVAAPDTIIACITGSIGSAFP